MLSTSGFHKACDLTLFKMSHLQIIQLTKQRSILGCFWSDKIQRPVYTAPRSPLETLAGGFGLLFPVQFHLTLPGTCQPEWFLSQALHIQNGDKNCLVARSKCFLKMGELEKSLKDAEASLQGDPTFCKVTVEGWRTPSCFHRCHCLQQPLVRSGRRTSQTA